MKIAVIGGGAAGMFASVFASQSNASVTLYEKNDKLGKKIYITGKGRCNLTNLTDEQNVLNNIVSNKKFFYGAIHKWSSANTFDFFSNEKLALKVERGNRVFPVSDKASDVTKTLQRKLTENGVDLRLNSSVKSISITENQFFVSTISDIVSYDKVILACGGMSYPSTGSNGDGFKFAKQLGHKIVEPLPALCEILLHEDVSPLEGLSLKNVVLQAKFGNDVLFEENGEMLFTAEGISGPLALSCSSFINRLTLSQVKLFLDLKPALALSTENTSKPTLDSRLQRDFAEFSNKEFKNSLVNLLPSRMANYIVSNSPIAYWQKVNQITAVQRLRLEHMLKNLQFSPKSLSGFSNAIVTSGGVDVSEVNPSTMESKICKGLYICGEMLDVDALTGGFNLQIAFSSGYVAGTSSIKEQK